MADVSLSGVSKSFGPVQVLRDIDLDVRDGEFTVFVGPSGCGKSTLLRIIAGLEKVSAGEIKIGGNRVNEVPPAGRKIAMVFQSYALYPHMTVYRNMAFGLKFTRTSKEDADRRVRQAAESLQLTPYLNRKPRDLSGGQRQRVAIGRAIVREPAVFLFDEPLSNLDAALRINTRIEIARLHRELKATTIYVTHDQVEAMTLASRIVVINQGVIEQVGPPLALYHKPANLFVAGFIGSPRMNLVKGTVQGIDESGVTVACNGSRATFAVEPGTAKPGEPVTIGFRPEHTIEGEHADLAIRLAGTVDQVEHLGESSFIYLRLDDGTDVIARTPGDSPATVGERLPFAAPPAQIHLFDAAGKAFARR
jgi:multiple sugar transport system ATP-binding protein